LSGSRLKNSGRKLPTPPGFNPRNLRLKKFIGALSIYDCAVRYTNELSMATVRFTQNIQRHVQCPTREIAGSTLRAVLDQYFQENERARGYVLDEQGRIRQHMVVFIDGEMVRDRDGLSDAVGPDSKVDVIQALSGG
jgi:hypothetical protein